MRPTSDGARVRRGQPHTRSSDPTSWALLKRATTLLGLAGGGVIAVSPRWVRFTAPLAVLAWAGGAGWLVIETLVADGT